MSASANRPKLLIIDDNPRFLESAAKELAELFEVRPLLAQRQAPKDIVAAVQAFGPRYLLLDLNLAGAVSSRDALRALAEHQALRGCDVRLISFGSGTLAERAENTEGHDHMAATGENPPAAEERVGETIGTSRVLPAVAAEDFEEQVIESYRRISPRVRGPLIRKPISAFALQAELLGTEFYEAPAEWRNMPLPLRVLDRHWHEGRWLSRVVYANPAWRQANMYRPEPERFRDWLERGICPNKRYRYGGNPFDQEASAYRIHSFLLQQEGRDYLGQIAEGIVQAPRKDSLDDSIQAIFRAMDRAGFPHGQCFLHKPAPRNKSSVIEYQSLDRPPSDGDVETGEAVIGTVVQLCAVSADHPQALKDQLPVVKPLRGELRKRTRAYYPVFEQEKPHPRRLIYRIRKAEDDEQAGDADIAEWSRCLGQHRDGENPIQSWLEIPVLALPEHPLGEDRKPGRWPRIVAVLMFSRAGTRAAHSTALRDADLDVTEEAVAPAKTMLLGLIDQLRWAIFNEHRRQYIAAQNRIAHYDRLLHAAADMRSKKQLLVECFGQVTGADYTFLDVPEPDGQRFLINNALWQRPGVPPLPAVARTTQTPIDNEALGIVPTWRRQIAYYTQDGYQSTHTRKLDDEYGTILGEQAEEWIAWSKTNVGTTLVFPVLVNTRSLGVMLLYFRKPWQLIDDLIPHIDGIAHRARWVLQADATEAERASWLQAIGHEIRRDLYTADNAFHRLADEFKAPFVDPAASPKALPIWRRLRRGLINAMSLAENWMDAMRDVSAGDPGPTFAPIDAIDAYLELNRELFQSDNYQIDIRWQVGRDDPVWRTALAHRDWFERVLRVLLDNAWKFGHAYLEGLDDEAAVPIELRAALRPGDHPNQVGVLEIDIRNPGWMSAEAWRHRFDAVPPPSERKRDGAHAGLHAALKLSRAVGGNIELDNMAGEDRPESEQQVIARLRWPLHRGEKDR